MGERKPLDEEGSEDARTFKLDEFFPYLVRVFYRAVSESISDVYKPIGNLSPPEWRTLVVLGPRQALSASAIVERSSMDKVAVSRAIKRLREAKLLKRDIDGEDNRRAVLRLTDDGVALHRRLVPLVRQREQELLVGLSEAERKQLMALMRRVRQNAVAATRRE